jgi:hypothetical protein
MIGSMLEQRIAILGRGGAHGTSVGIVLIVDVTQMLGAGSGGGRLKPRAGTARSLANCARL